jgi:lipopolysaccharide/colanic/teichoic acid biosynthesis glycosyltransferase
MNTDTAHLIDAQSVVRLPPKQHAPVAISYNVPQTLYTSRLKRLLDVAISLFLISAFLSWITAILFVLIRTGSKGPLFFIQERKGHLGKTFSCIKFRTMRLTDDSGTVQASDDDARITRIGRFLRITHIDELPQLINVLLNDMSLVGPRPHMLYHDLLFSGLLPRYQLRHLVKPGITGLAQSAGFHGATNDFLSISNRTRLDLFYVKRMSFRLDLSILLTTLFIVPVKCVKRLYAGGN